MLKARYRPDIDGLRAVAILAVVAFHGFPTIIPGGFVGVDVFFVISGFLISGILFNDLATGNFSLLKFYGRRVRRIFPALILILAASLIAGWFFLLPVDLKDLSWQAISSSLFASNFFFWQQAGYFDTSAETKMLLHLWSLGVEEQFYILWPVMLYVAHKWRWNKLVPIAAIFVLSFAVNLIFLRRAPVATFYLPFSRLWELVLGSLLAYAFSHPRIMATLHAQLVPGVTFRAIRDIAGILGIALIVYSAMHFTAGDLYPGLRALYPTLGAALLIFAGERSLINEMLGTRLFVFIGLISYPLYMWHWPLLAFLRTRSLEPLSPTVIWEAIALSLILAWLTYAFVESPIRFKSVDKRLATRSLLVAMCCTILLAGTGILTQGFEERLPPMLRALNNTFDSNWLAEHWHAHCFKVPGDKPGDDCIDREPKGAPLVMLWGDSQAASLYPGFRALQLTRHFRLAESTATACPPILDYDEPVRPGGGPDVLAECLARNKQAVEQIVPLRPAAVVILAAWWRYSLSPRWEPLVLNELKATIRTLKGAGASRIILLGPLPTWQPQSLTKLLMKAWQQNPSAPLPDRIAYGLAPTLPQVNASLKKVAQQEGIIYVAPMDYFCDKEGCLTKLGNGPHDLETWDDAHLTPIASSYLINAIEPILFGKDN
jgi:peptidoglycan/LPS O-acetylase OafA/YrhL